MATKEKVKKNNTKKAGNMSIEQDSWIVETSSSSQLKDSSVYKKLDLLLEVVKGLDTKIQNQGARLLKQEECVSIVGVSALPSAQILPKKSTDQP